MKINICRDPTELVASASLPEKLEDSKRARGREMEGDSGERIERRLKKWCSY